ncbi:MAG: LacI family DNA-binding transcriptional regulator [Planctomycetota bacterium]|nr:LacI family DNA-binding transcriptional regulator [Planctomycetota bacterium]
MPLNMKDIADAVGVSRTTVSRVLSGKAEQFRIARKTAERIIAEAKARGYRPSELARGLRTARSNTLGLVVSDISNPFFANIAWAAEQAAEKAGFATVIGSSGEDPAREKAYIENLRSRGADGLIIASAGGDYEHLFALKNEGYPFVLLDRVFEDLDCDFVAVDNVRASRDLIEKLIDRVQPARVAFLGGRMETSTGRGRLEGYRAALRARKIEFDNDLVIRGDYSVESGRMGTEALLALKRPPDAIFCANNKILFGCLERLAAAPGEPWTSMPVASFDVTPFMQIVGRRLIVASQPERAIGARAVELLIKRVLSAPPGTPRMGKPFEHALLDVELRQFGM